MLVYGASECTESWNDCQPSCYTSRVGFTKCLIVTPTTAHTHVATTTAIVHTMRQGDNTVPRLSDYHSKNGHTLSLFTHSEDIIFNTSSTILPSIELELDCPY